MNALRGAGLTIDGRATDVSETARTTLSAIQVLFAAGTADYISIKDAEAAYTSFQSAQSGFLSYLRTLCENILIAQVNRDVKLPSLTVAEALKELIKQMVSSSDSVKANVPALGSQTSIATPAGTGLAIVGTVKTGKGTYSGKEFAIAETIFFETTKDAQSGGATEDSETITVTGQNVQTNMLEWDWPQGSGKTTTITVCNPELSNQSAGNVLQNSGFDTFDSSHTNQPDNWVKVVGTAGTDYAKETSTVFAGSAAALKLVGNAGGTAVLVNLTQAFNTTASTTLDAGGTPYDITDFPETNYILSYWIKADVVPAAGVLTIDLIDGSNNVIADTGSTNNTYALTLSGISTSYVQKSARFALPKDVPSTVKIRIRVTTAISTGSNIYIDDLALMKAVPLYTTGPEFAIFRGSVATLTGDRWTMALTISASGAIQRGFQKLFKSDTLTGGPFYLPSNAAGSETVADTLIS